MFLLRCLFLSVLSGASEAGAEIQLVLHFHEIISLKSGAADKNLKIWLLSQTK